MKNIAKWLVVALFATIICTTVQGAESLEDIERREEQEREGATLRAMNEHIRSEDNEKKDARKKLGQREQRERDAQQTDQQLMDAVLQASLEEAAQEEAKRASTEKREEYVFPQVRSAYHGRHLFNDQQLYRKVIETRDRLKAAKTKEQAQKIVEKIVNDAQQSINRTSDRS